MSKKHKKVYTVSIYTEHLLILIYMVTSHVSISPFVSLESIVNFAIGLRICVITAGINKYESIIKKKGKSYDKIVLLAKNYLNTIEVLISKDFIDCHILVLMNSFQ